MSLTLMKVSRAFTAVANVFMTKRSFPAPGESESLAIVSCVFCVFPRPPVSAAAAASRRPEPRRNNRKLPRKRLLAVPGRRRHPVDLGDVVQGPFQVGGVLPNGSECWE